MKASNMLAKPKIKNNCILLGAYGNNKIHLVGSSIPASYEPGWSEGVNFLYFNMPPEKKKAIIAIVVDIIDEKGRIFGKESVFLCPEREEGDVVCLDLDRNVFFPEGILPMIYHVDINGGFCGYINIKTADGEFTIDHGGKNFYPGKFLVRDNSDLCCFLAGDVSLQEFKEMADFIQSQKTKFELLKNKAIDLLVKIQSKATEIEVGASGFWVDKKYVRRLVKEIIDLTYANRLN